MNLDWSAVTLPSVVLLRSHFREHQLAWVLWFPSFLSHVSPAHTSWPLIKVWRHSSNRSTIRHIWMSLMLHPLLAVNWAQYFVPTLARFFHVSRPQGNTDSFGRVVIAMNREMRPPRPSVIPEVMIRIFGLRLYGQPKAAVRRRTAPRYVL